MLRGEIQRGTVEDIDAVLLLGDLQGFTKISETSDRDDLIAMLNDYFECAVEAVHEAGGQVLKFLGDGFLAIFSLGDEAPEVSSFGGKACLVAFHGMDRFPYEQPFVPIRKIALRLRDLGTPFCLCRSLDAVAVAEQCGTNFMEEICAHAAPPCLVKWDDESMAK